jgi:hypothetical protein
VQFLLPHQTRQQLLLSRCESVTACRELLPAMYAFRAKLHAATGPGQAHENLCEGPIAPSVPGCPTWQQLFVVMKVSRGDVVASAVALNRDVCMTPWTAHSGVVSVCLK